jgi:hypothetical protein
MARASKYVDRVDIDVENTAILVQAEPGTGEVIITRRETVGDRVDDADLPMSAAAAQELSDALHRAAEVAVRARRERGESVATLLGGVAGGDIDVLDGSIWVMLDRIVNDAEGRLSGEFYVNGQPERLPFGVMLLMWFRFRSSGECFMLKNPADDVLAGARRDK